jgi:hypothetical protein
MGRGVGGAQRLILRECLRQIVFAQAERPVHVISRFLNGVPSSPSGVRTRSSFAV